MMVAPVAVATSNGTWAIHSTLSEVSPPADGPAPAGGTATTAIREAHNRANSFFKGTSRDDQVSGKVRRSWGGSSRRLGLGPAPFGGSRPLADIEDHLTEPDPVRGHLDAFILADELQGLL